METSQIVSSPKDAGAAPSTPRPAATVMLLREAAGGAEVLVIRRHEQLAFMGGLWVFPGGTLTASDCSDMALSCIPGGYGPQWPVLTDLHGNALETRQCLGLAVAACRETFEEAGVLLARPAAAEAPAASVSARAQERRHEIAARPELFTALLCEEQLLLDLRGLIYWAHWITPSNVPRRFDTRFFAIRVPPGQSATVDTTETVDHAWLTPAALLAAAAAGSMPLAQPTLYNLMVLEASLRVFGSLPAALAEQAQRQIVPVLPKVQRTESTLMVLPWDPQYLEIPGENAPQQIAYPQWLSSLPSRVRHGP